MGRKRGEREGEEIMGGKERRRGGERKETIYKGEQ
jgi:hypothetical protein